tara:strand:+ start:191 stop:778 length:588 start_codon:yes stop_codon:yes gene_type:complete
VPCVPDVHDLDGKDYRGITLLTGGFPCQPYSLAGKRGGSDDDRAIWPEMARVIDEARPTWVLGENVAGLVSMGLDDVLSDMEGMGYAVQTFCVPACAVDAKHRRERLWIVAHGEGIGRDEFQDEDYRDLDGKKGIQVEAGGEGLSRDTEAGGARWQAEPDVGRVAHGVSNRVDRLKGLGNAIVPQVAYEILRLMK